MTTTYKDMALDLIEKHITEEEGFAILHLLKRKFDWAGTVFTRDDIRSQISWIRDVQIGDLDGDESADWIVDRIAGDRYWREGLEDWMCEQGWECVYDAVAEAQSDWEEQS